MAVAVETLLTAEIQRPARYLGNELGAIRRVGNRQMYAGY